MQSIGKIWEPRIEIPREGILLKMPPELYHKVDAMSSTKIKALLDSPAYFESVYVSKTIEEKQSKEMIFGTYAHIALLEPDIFLSRKVVLPDFGDLRSSKNRETKAEHLKNLPENCIILSPEESENINGMLRKLLHHSVIAGIFKDGISEVSGFWYDKEFDLWCRFREDYHVTKEKMLVDYKTTRSARTKQFTYQFQDLNYDMQMAHYRMGCRRLGLAVDDVLIVAQETEPPYLVNQFRVSEEYLEIGEQKRRYALTQYKEALKTGYWPGLREEIVDLVPSPYYGNSWE